MGRICRTNESEVNKMLVCKSKDLVEQGVEVRKELDFRKKRVGGYGLD